MYPNSEGEPYRLQAQMTTSENIPAMPQQTGTDELRLHSVLRNTYGGRQSQARAAPTTRAQPTSTTLGGRGTRSAALAGPSSPRQQGTDNPICSSASSACLLAGRAGLHTRQAWSSWDGQGMEGKHSTMQLHNYRYEPSGHCKITIFSCTQ